MFGILRPCRHALPDGLADEWTGHLCGMCLALRDDHGQAARVATNYDGLVISVLVAAQTPGGTPTRTAGPCPLRGMRRAEVARGEGARLAAAVSLVLASAKVDDHVLDADGLYGRRAVRGAARRLAGHWARAARRSGGELGFDGGALLTVVERQREAEEAAGPGGDVLSVTAPTEEATGQAFAHTAVLAGRPHNADPLREAGRLFGRIAHLLDAVEDRERDDATGAWNPISATQTPIDEIRRLCDDAVLGVRLALAETAFDDDRLVRALLEDELAKAVRRTFGHAGHSYGGPHHPHGHPGHPTPPPGRPHGDGYHGHGGSHGPTDAGRGGWRPAQGRGSWCDRCCEGCTCETPKLHSPPKQRGPITGCAIFTWMCCTCQFCCRDPHPGPWSGKARDSWCNACECCQCCEVCRCCECCDCGL
ncbi:DUF5685 family protein [Marinactinospora thermotolerans]|uniref:Regulatory protein n=1 Tax=Marinactinospora thermotolerans DSM 45154 TaxID=1122192 RepID=A0A1T4JYE8_9ACTN|nr:DUF5685 family protein [Marinactinospora thermotolerans]SJZ35139.1 hypothetical protein SAMN02745673_00058 [Marinactinospora thermotolerans DSM 45154]